MDEPSRQRFIAAQPLSRIQTFARLLGWNDLRLHVVSWPESPAGFFPAYCTTDERFNLQIGQRHDLGPDHYAACVIAERYGISSAPHQPFTLFPDDESLRAEARRLFPLLGRANFKNPHWRRQFALKYPIRIMHRYRQRNKFLNEIRYQADALAQKMRKLGLNPYAHSFPQE